MPYPTLLTAVILCASFIPGHEVGSADDWPQWRGPQRDGVWREKGVRMTLGGPLAIKWRRPIASGYTSPTVADGRVYVADRVEELEQRSESGSTVTDVERVHCFSAADGKPLWNHTYPCAYRGVSYEAGPRASVLVHEKRAYHLGTMGHLHCYDAATGKVLWKKDLYREYEIRMPRWGVTGSPIIEQGLLIVPACGKNAYLVAFDPATGKERWRAFSDRGNYAAPIVIDQNGRRVLVCWTADRIIGVFPEDGKLAWEYAFKGRMPLGVASPVHADGKLFFTGFYDGSLLLEVAPDDFAVKKIWQRAGQSERSTDALHSIIATPFIRGEHIYGVDSYGELRCLSLATGDRVWESLDAVPRARWATIHFVQHGERTWMFNERGELILARLSQKGFEELGRAKLIDPTLGQLNRRDGVCWSHPAFAGRHVFARNDEEIVCADLSATVEKGR